MSTNVITSERRRLAPFIDRLNGRDAREGYRAIFENAAGRFALGKIDGPEFTGIVGELIRDASGDAAQQDRDADREAWATMPTDGSGHMGRAERVVVFLAGVFSAVVLVWIGLLMAGVFGTSPDAPAAPLPMATAADMRETDTALITRGAYWSWEAFTECGNGPAACDAVLRDVNRQAHAYGVHVWEDGSVSPLN